jgi:hypothetical protein
LGRCGGYRIDDAADELEELRCAEDRVRDRPRLDQLLLGDLRAEVAAVRKPVGADNRQRNVMSHPGSLLCGEQIARRPLEELQHRRVFPGGRVRDVDDDLGARQRLGESLASEAVDA